LTVVISLPARLFRRPPPMVARLPSEDAPDMMPGPAPGNGPVLPVVVAITYRDGLGRESIRRVRFLRSRMGEAGAVYIEAWCYERDAMRCFRADRIVEMIDLQTGEVFRQAPRLRALLAPHAAGVAIPPDPTDFAIRQYWAGLVLLSVLARSDGFLSAPEVDVIVDFVCEMEFGAALDLAALHAIVGRLMPDRGDFSAALEEMARRTGAERRSVLRHARILAESDGEVTGTEADILLDLRAALQV